MDVDSLVQGASRQSGTLDLIGGPMFSGKTTELLRRLFIEAEIGLNVLYINHSNDNRSEGPFSTHNPLYKKELSTMSNVSFISAVQLSNLDFKCDVIGIDEAQFFDDLVDVVEKMVEKEGKHVIVSGLNGDFRRRKFGHLLDLEPLSDSYTKLQSYCKQCAMSTPKKRTLAPFSHRISRVGDVNEVGGYNKYIPVCRECYLHLNSCTPTC